MNKILALVFLAVFFSASIATIPLALAAPNENSPWIQHSTHITAPVPCETKNGDSGIQYFKDLDGDGEHTHEPGFPPVGVKSEPVRCFKN